MLTVVIMDLAGNPLTLFFLGTNQASAQAGEVLLHLLAIGDVYRHTQHPLGVAIAAVIEFSSGRDPPNDSVDTNNSKFGDERFPVFPGVSDLLQDAFSVFRVHLAAKLVPGPGVAVQWDSEHRFQVTEPAISIALDVPIPSYRPPGVHRQAKPLVCDRQASFGLS